VIPGHIPIWEVIRDGFLSDRTVVGYNIFPMDGAPLGEGGWEKLVEKTLRFFPMLLPAKH
jgi:hypothetical protein